LSASGRELVRLQSAVTASLVEKIRKPDPDWKKIVGLHVENDGSIAVVWLGVDVGTKTETGAVHLYHSRLFGRNESLVVVADAINQRGQVPIACEKSGREIVLKLREKGCRVSIDKNGEPASLYTETDAVRSANSREIVDRMVAGTFRVWDTNEDWLDEEDHFREKDQAAPDEGFPLQAATRHAFHHLKDARVPEAKRKKLPPRKWGGSVV
jgi:hypothetical protein